MEATETEIKDDLHDGISNLIFDKQSNNLLVSSWDGSLRLYDVNDNTLKNKIQYEAALLDCCFIDHTVALSGGLEQTLKMTDLTTSKDSIIGEHKLPVRCVLYNETGQMAITGSWDQTMKLWDTRSQDPCIGSYDQPGKVFTMSVSQSKIIVGTSTRQVWIWDSKKMSEPLQKRESSLKYQTRCIRSYVEGDGYALSSTEGRVAMEYFDPSPNIQTKKYAFKCHRLRDANGIEQVYPVNTLAFHPLYGTFASGGDDGIVNIWDGKNKKRLCQFRKYPTSIASLAFNYDGSYLAIASSYTYFDYGNEQNIIEGVKDQIFIRSINDAEVQPKQRQVK